METVLNNSEIEKEMEKFKFLTFADILRALKLHPEWLVELRKLILTSELLELPRKVDELINRISKIEIKVDKIENDVGVLKQDVTVLKQDVAVLKLDVKNLKDDVGDLKGKFLELHIGDKIGAFVGNILRKARLIDFSDLADTLYEAADKGIVSEKEVRDVLKLDDLVEGYMRKRDKKRVFVAVEASHVADRNDVERAFRRAEIVFKVYGIECIPTIIGEEFTEGSKDYAEEIGGINHIKILRFKHKSTFCPIEITMSFQ